MVFNYYWKRKEANFGKPLKRQVKGGTHVTFEIIPTYRGRVVALRRQSIPGHEKPPGAKEHTEGMLFFCHNLIRYAEPMDVFVNRVVKSQTGIGIKNWNIVDFESFWQDKDDQWALLGYIVAELEKLPKPGLHGNRVKEVLTFTSKDIPNNFAWWSKEELRAFLRKHLNLRI